MTVALVRVGFVDGGVEVIFETEGAWNFVSPLNIFGKERVRK